MKYSGKFILAMFNASKSGKSMVFVDGKMMYVISQAIYAMIQAGQITEVEFAPSTDIVDDASGEVVFNTSKVKDWTESRIARIAEANKLIEAAEGFDQERYDKAKAKLDAITI